MEFKVIMKGIGEDLLEGNISQAKYLISGNVPAGEVEQINSGLDLIQALEKHHLLSMENTEILQDLLTNIGRRDLVKRLKKYEQQFCRKVNHLSVDVPNIVPHYVETNNCQKLVDGMEKGNVVILKGIAASGKSQLAFWYAKHFRRRNRNSVICRLQCTSEDEIMQSLQKLLTTLKVSFESKETDKNKYIQEINGMACDKLGETSEESCHLLIFDDIKCFETVARLMIPVRQIKNVKIICTTYNADFLSLESKQFNDTVIQMGRVSDEEALKFFSFASEEDVNDLLELARQLDFLPFSLICADCYMGKTKTGVKDYMKRLRKHDDFLQHVEEALKTEIRSYSKELVAALKTSLDDVINNIKPESRDMLKMTQFQDKNDIPFSLLECLLPDGADKDLLVDNMIMKLQGYSLCVIEGKGKDRKVSLHAMTRYVLLSTLSDDEKRDLLRKLISIFCRNMNIDSRCKDILKRNLTFRRHALIVFKKFIKIFECKEKGFEIKLLQFCMVAILGVTFCQYGNEDLMAEEYLEKAKSYLFNLAEVDYDVLQKALGNTYDLLSWISKMFRTGAEEENSNEHRTIAELFKKLVAIGKTIPDDLLTKLVISNVRSLQDIQQIKDAAQKSGIPESVKCSRSHLTIALYEEMVKKGLAKPMEMIKQVFLVESLIVISYNSARNLYQCKFENDLAITRRQCDFRLSYLLGQKLEDKCSGYLSVHYLVTKRNNLLYYILNNIKSLPTKDIIDRLEEAIRRYEALLIVKDIHLEFGIVKMSQWHSPHNQGMCLQRLVYCYSELYGLHGDKQEKDRILQEGLIHVKKLEALSENMSTEWVAVSRFHVFIGRFYKTIGKRDYCLQALGHFEKAIQLQREFEMFGISRVYIDAAFGLVECCIEVRDEEYLAKGKATCRDLTASLQSNKQELHDKAERHLKEITMLKNNTA